MLFITTLSCVLCCHLVFEKDSTGVEMSANYIVCICYFIINIFRRNTYEMPLKWDNYEEKLSDLLHIEEKQMEVDIRRYDLEGAIMNQDGKFLRLKVSHFLNNFFFRTTCSIITYLVDLDFYEI